jgi:DNA-binding beta-propeller fold protein YncE
MKLARNVCIEYSVFILLALLTSGAMMIHGTAFAQEETFVKVGQINVPGGLNSFDIGFVDPHIGRYFLADRTNKAIDQVVTSTNTIHLLAAGEFVGVQPGTNTSGPNGVITANDHTEVWAADGVLCGACGATTPATQTSRIQVIDIKTGEVTHTIDNGGQRRADELCVDPQHHVVLVANDDELDLFLTFISTNTYKIVGTIKLDGTDSNAQKIKATGGIEQCQWSPRTGKFYLAIPEVAGSGANTTPGAVLEINPVSMKVEKVFPIDFAFLSQTGTTPATADCLGPQGLAIGPDREILLGCSNSGKGSVIIDERNGDLVRSLDGLNGSDEVWYNPGNNHYFLAESNHTGGAILGVVDQRPDTIGEDASPATAAGSHSVAVDPVFNQIYVPGNKAATSICSSTNGCIAIFMSAASDPGICGGKENAFKSQVCPDKKGKPGTN